MGADNKLNVQQATWPRPSRAPCVTAHTNRRWRGPQSAKPQSSVLTLALLRPYCAVLPPGRGRHRRVRCMYDVSSFVGRLVLKRIVVHLQSLLVVVWLEHELEHTWPGIGL